jgi:glycosyltransferase involved in cell wall biosynthesis
VLAGEPRFVAERERREVEAALAPVAALVDRPGWIEPGDLFSRIDLLVVPSVQPESFGLVVTEAMSAGVPVVVSDAGALPEVVGPSIDATFRAGDPRALAELIRARKKRGLSESRESDRARWNDSYSPSSGKSAIDGLLARMALSGDS